MPGGRPPKYTAKEELAKKINEYFEWCDSQKKIITTEKGGVSIIYKPYTITGLCVYLGITRETLCQYEKKPEFSDTIKNAKLKIENWVEEKSLTGDLNPTVSIFNLKNNFGWKDKQEIEQNIGNKDDKPFQVNIKVVE